MPHAPLRTALGLLALAAPLALATSCSSTGGDSGATDGSSGWVEPSPALERQIEVRAMEVSVAASPEEFVELSDWFQGVGEPAYPKLIEMIKSGDKRQRSFALSVVAAAGDRRLIGPIEAAMPTKALEDRQHQYEYARALAKLGDFSMLPTLIEGLQDDDEFTRRQAYRALQSVTNSQIAYSATAPPEERAKAVEAWMAWWEVQQQDELLRND